jgi:hypothetical protein
VTGDQTPQHRNQFGVLAIGQTKVEPQLATYEPLLHQTWHMIGDQALGSYVLQRVSTPQPQRLLQETHNLIRIRHVWDDALRVGATGPYQLADLCHQCTKQVNVNIRSINGERVSAHAGDQRPFG